MRHPFESLFAEYGKKAFQIVSEAPYNLSVNSFTSEDGYDAYVIDYDQINSPRNHPLVDECRGIVVDPETGEVVCWPFRRFYNVGEFPELEKEFHWPTAFATSKEDGSLIKVYYYKGLWRIGTRGTAFGDNTIFNLVGEDSHITFRDLFLRTLGMSYEQFQDEMNYRSHKNNQFFFELCTKENRAVKRYDTDKIFMIGVRGADTSHVFSYTRFLKNVYDVRYFKFNSFENAIESAKSLKDLDEGFVLCDGNGMRLKVKSPIYVAAHHAKGNALTPKRAVDLVLANEHHEFLQYFPEYEEFIMKFANRLDEIKQECFNIGMKIANGEYPSKKEFALTIKDLPYSGILFHMWNGKNFSESFDSLLLNSKYRVLGAFE